MNSKAIFYLLVPLLLSGCNSQTKNTTSDTATDTIGTTSVTAVEVEETPAMCGWKCHGLLGRVKSVRYANGACLEFNSDGNLTQEITVWEWEGNKSTDTLTNVYSSPNAYSRGEDCTYKIEYEKNTRSEVEQGGEYFRDSFTFDNLGRLIKSNPNVGFGALTIEYKYDSEKDKLPSMQTDEGGDESGIYLTVNKFEYLKTDTKGNWTERKVTRKAMQTDEEEKKSVTTETLTEKREITYF